LWYDFHMNNPRNPDARGIGRKEVRMLFRNCPISLGRITLAPPVSRLLVPRSLIMALLLEKLKLFNAHYIGVIRKIQGESF